VALRLFRFRRFSTRLLILLLGLLVAALGTIYLIVSSTFTATTRIHAQNGLKIAADVFDVTIRQRIDHLASSAEVMAGDYAFKQVLQSDAATLSSALESYTRRVHAPVIALLDPDGKLRATSNGAIADIDAEPFRRLIELAKEKDSAEVDGFAYFKGQLHVLVAVPLYAPYPEVVAWFGLGFPIDRAFAESLKRTTRVDVSFVSTPKANVPSMLATTLPPPAVEKVSQLAPIIRDTPLRLETLYLPREPYLTFIRRQQMLGDRPVFIVLQHALAPDLEEARALQLIIGLMAVMTFLAATILARRIARGVSEPVTQLAAHTQVIARGDYNLRIALDRADELGQLADAMNQMSAGLAERDRVRDLLDKNVSPEVAAQLMRDGGAALGGEEREVTILFADLRGFTSLSEKLSPRDLLTLLNRYLDRMSAAIEAHGGVIDKFIGDAIMALFGAPVAQGDAVNRAVAAALAMERALVELNAELAAEGRPPLAIGVGVNTARVVAGNIGSHRRLNYSVIGDGVNVAARLQSLTRTAEYRTNVITSAATVAACRKSGTGILPVSSDPGPEAGAIRFRPLGPVQVKGRAEPVEIFAIE